MKLITLLAASAVLLAPLSAPAAPAASFNYQGYLADANSAATGNYYFSFSIYAAANGGAALATYAPVAPLPVNQGYFQTVINHTTVPGLFADGQVKYLQISVKRQMNDAWTTLNPRQEVHPAPMAQNAEVLLSRNNTFTGSNTFGGATSFSGGTISGGTFSGTTFSGTNTFGGTVGFTGSPTFNQNLNVLGDALLSGAGSQMRITTDEQFAMTIDGSHSSGTWLTLINQRSVLSQNDNPHEWNLIASGVSNTEGARKLLLRDGTAGAVRLAVDSAGDVGIGTSDPQGKLEVATGNNRTLRIRDDLVPTIEASGAANDGLRGYMRLRNVLEVFPRADGSAAGKVDVRNTAGAPTITLNGSDGNIAAGSISAANMPAVKYTQTALSPRGNSWDWLSSDENRDISTLDVTAPAGGFIMVQANVQVTVAGGNSRGCFFKLMAGPPGGQLVEQIENSARTQEDELHAVIPLNWVIPVTAGQQLRLVTNLYAKGNAGANYYSRSLTALFIPNQLQ